MDHNDWPIVGMAHNDYDSFVYIPLDPAVSGLGDQLGVAIMKNTHNIHIKIQNKYTKNVNKVG